jgi:hypothetical protein
MIIYDSGLPVEKLKYNSSVSYGIWIPIELFEAAASGTKLGLIVRREKDALIPWEEGIPPGNRCSSRKQPGRRGSATGSKGSRSRPKPRWTGKNGDGGGRKTPGGGQRSGRRGQTRARQSGHRAETRTPRAGLGP